MSAIVDRYVEKFGKSAELFRRGSASIPGGGHQSRVVLPFPHYVNEAKGALKWDVDGNELVDYVIGFGSLILGHARAEVVEATSAQLSKGTHMGTPTELELDWAESVKGLVPSAERVRFTNSGTEATYLAIRLARAHTGKTMVIKFREHYHGWHDYVTQEAGIVSNVGIPEETLATVIVAEPRVADVKSILESRTDVAAIIFEAAGGHWGQFPLPNPGFVQDIRALTEKHGVVMIMDEVICGFRLSRGGAQGRFNVRPDLTTMAKIVAGGMPGGAVGGRAEILDLISTSDDAKRVPHPGTFNASPTSAAAGVAALNIIANEPINERADAAAARLKDGLRGALSKQEVTGHVHGIASIVHLALGVECDCGGEICTLPRSKLDESGAAQRRAMLKLAMLNEDVDMMGGVGFMLSAEHSDEQIDRTTDAFERALVAMRDDGVL